MNIFSASHLFLKALLLLFVIRLTCEIRWLYYCQWGLQNRNMFFCD